MFKLRKKYTAVIEPDAKVGFKAYIEEMPELKAQGNKITDLREDLLLQMEHSLQKAKTQIHLITSVRVPV